MREPSKKNKETEETRLSPREREIMDVIYRMGSATAIDIQEAMGDRLANATIRTQLRILEEKGHLTHTEKGRQYHYSPVRSRSKEARSAWQRLVGVFYEGSLKNAVAGMIESNDAKLNVAELEELERIIRKARAQREAES
jgi:predicted transcriptional regulator